MHDVPRKLTAEELAELFEGRTRLVEKLAERDDPLGSAREVIQGLTEEEKRALEAELARERLADAHRDSKDQNNHWAGVRGALNTPNRDAPPSPPTVAGVSFQALGYVNYEIAELQ